MSFDNAVLTINSILTMTGEEEKRLILLSAILQLGGSGSKQDVLDIVENSGVIVFSAQDLQVRRTRNELAWRNDLAFIRAHLVKDDCLHNYRDKWATTPRGSRLGIDTRLHISEINRS